MTAAFEALEVILHYLKNIEPLPFYCFVFFVFAVFIFLFFSFCLDSFLYIILF